MVNRPGFQVAIVTGLFFKIKNMNAKQKALELLIMFEKVEGKILQEYLPSSFKRVAKASALICVEEIFEFMKEDDLYSGTASNANSKWVQYWNEVKDEINSL